MKTKQEILEEIENLEMNKKLFLVSTLEWHTINSAIGKLRWVIE